MATTPNFLPLLAILAGSAALVTGILFLLRFVLGSSTSPAATVMIWYSVGLLLYGGSLYTGARLNPRDMVHGSWSDPYLQAATCVGFLACLSLPFRLPVSWLGRFGLAIPNLCILFAAFWLWYSATA